MEPWEKETEDAIYFWGGVFSNWHNSSFSCKFFSTDDSTVQFNCAEQYMMAHKAIAFNDYTRFALIMQSTSPRDQKMFGRQVVGFVDSTWAAIARNRSYPGIYSKFEQSKELKSLILSTGNKLIVEASPYDRRWGIGYNVFDAEDNKPHWYENWLGQCLMQVREDLRNGIGMTKFPNWEKHYKSPRIL